MIYLCAITIILFLITYVAFDRDVFHPVVLCSFFWMISSLSAAYNMDIWGSELSGTCILLISVSLVSMLMGSVFSRKIHGVSNKFNKQSRIVSISVSNWKYVVIMLIGILTAAIYIRSMLSVGRANGFVSGSGISALIRLYRNTSHFSSDVEDKVSGVASYLMQFFRIAAYLMTYIGINNVVANTRLKGNVRYFTITLLFLILVLITGARMQLIKMAIFITLTYFILSKKKEDGILELNCQRL